MIFINSAIRQIGDKNLIIQLKSKEFFTDPKDHMRKEDFENLFNLLTSKDQIPIPLIIQTNLLLNACYYLVKFNKDVFRYINDIKNSYNQKNFNDKEKLFILFNLIEIQRNYSFLNENDLNNIFNFIYSYNSNNNYEENLLKKYYSAEIKFLLNDFINSNKISTDILVDFNNNNNNIIKSDFINFLKIRNNLLIIKILEKEDINKNLNNLINQYECLFEILKGLKEDYAIIVGFKLIHLTNNLNSSIKILEELLKILHKEMLFGKSHKNIISEFLNICALLGYHNVLIDNKEKTKKLINKIDKKLNIMKESKNKDNIRNNSINSNINIVNNNSSLNKTIDEYEFINICLKSICSNNLDKNNNINILENYKNLIGDVSKNDSIILDLLILGDKNIQNIYQQRENFYIDILKNKIDQNNMKQIFLCYLFTYNKISTIFKNINEDKNNKITEIKNLSKLLIDYTNNFVKSNLYLNNLFQVNIYFKDLFNRIYFMYLYTFFLEGKFDECLNEFNLFNDLIQFQYELKTNQKSYFDIMKLKGDILFKKGKFKEAIESYSNIINEFNSVEIDFNLGLCYLFENDKKKGMNLLEKSKEIYLERKENEKVNIINGIINKIY